MRLYALTLAAFVSACAPVSETQTTASIVPSLVKSSDAKKKAAHAMCEADAMQFLTLSPVPPEPAQSDGSIIGVFQDAARLEERKRQMTQREQAATATYRACMAQRGFVD